MEPLLPYSLGRGHAKRKEKKKITRKDFNGKQGF